MKIHAGQEAIDEAKALPASMWLEAINNPDTPRSKYLLELALAAEKAIAEQHHDDTTASD